jgi:hypothetical protein
MYKKVKLAASSAAIAMLLPLAANAIDQAYANKLERSGCTQASELQGCDINKSKAENAKAGFGTAEATEGGDSAPEAAIKACNKFANEGYDGTIVSQSAMKPGWWEVVMRFEQYRYACNVSSSGEVESFNKLN